MEGRGIGGGKEEGGGRKERKTTITVSSAVVTILSTLARLSNLPLTHGQPFPDSPAVSAQARSFLRYWASKDLKSSGGSWSSTLV